MRGPSRVAALGTAVLCLTSCHHWYTRGAMAIGGAAALGAVGGSLIPCTMDQPDCQSSNATGGAAIAGMSALFFWGMAEIVIAMGPGSSDDDYSGYSGGSSGSSGDDGSSSGGDTSSGGDDSSSGGGDTSSGGDDGAYSGGDDSGGGSVTVDPGAGGSADDSCHDVRWGGSSDTSIEPELFASGDDQVHITSGGTGEGFTLPDACGEAKMYAGEYLRDRCPSVRTQSTYLTQWIIYRQECSCQVCPDDQVGGFTVHCSVNVEGVCQVGAEVVAEHGYGWGSDDASATAMAFGYARQRCVGAEVERRVLGCDSATHNGEERHACHVAITCRRQ